MNGADRANLILGKGGFGTVVRDATDSNIAHKLLKEAVTCTSARKEYENHRLVHNEYIKLRRRNPKIAQTVYVPAAFKFSSSPGCLDKTGQYPCAQPYMCLYSMERVRSKRQDGIMEHVILSGDYQDYPSGRVIFTNRAVQNVPNTTYINANMKRYGPRGAFLGIKTLRQRGIDVKNLAFRIGILYQLVFNAGLNPKDVEVVLDSMGRLALMDFGMVHEAYSGIDVDIDMYIPSRDDSPELFAAFERGRKMAARGTPVSMPK
jgi:hypothetical protein